MHNPHGLPPPPSNGVDLVSVLRAERARLRENLDIIEQALADAIAKERARAGPRKEHAA